MIEIEVSCRACREIFVPSSADIRRGVWRTCPPCRDGPGDTEPERHDHDTHEPAEGRTERTSP